MRNFQFSIFNFQKGFTLIELLLSIAIAAIAVTIVTLSFSKLNDNQALDKAALSIISVLDEARNLTLSSKDAMRYGVKLEDSQIIILPTYATTTLHSLVGVRNINLSGGVTTIWFDRLTGRTSQTGTIEVYLKSATTTYKTITINGNGLAQ